MIARRLDDVDRRILEFLSRDARISNREIAQALGIVEGTVRGRIKRLQKENTIRIMPVTSTLDESSPSLAYLGIHAELAKAHEAAEAVAALPFVRFVATMLGRYDILAMTAVSSGAELIDQAMRQAQESVRRAASDQAIMVQARTRAASLISAFMAKSLDWSVEVQWSDTPDN